MYNPISSIRKPMPLIRNTNVTSTVRDLGLPGNTIIFDMRWFAVVPNTIPTNAANRYCIPNTYDNRK